MTLEERRMPAKETVVRLLWYVESKALTKLTEAREGIFVKVVRKIHLRHVFSHRS